MSEKERKDTIDWAVRALSKFMQKQKSEESVNKIIKEIRELPQPPFTNPRKY